MTTTAAAISDEADAPRPRRERLLAFAAFVAICAIWGTTFLAIRVAIETIPTLYLTEVRFTAAGVILLVIAALRGQPMPRRASQWGHEAVTGILLFSMANGAVVRAEHYIASGLAALLAATLPLWMALLERFLKRSERLTSGRRRPRAAGADHDPHARRHAPDPRRRDAGAEKCVTPARSHEAFLRERATPVEVRAARLTRLYVERVKNHFAQIDLSVRFRTAESRKRAQAGSPFTLDPLDSGL